MVAIKLKVDDQTVLHELKEFEGRLSKPQEALKECGLVLIRSVAKNFSAAGRPTRWKPSVRARKSKGQTLVKTARLKNSMSMKVDGNTLKVGTNVKYARIHQLGGHIRKNVAVRQHYRNISRAFGKPISRRRVLFKSHTRKMDMEITARPFLVVQNEDVRIFKRIFEEHLLP